MRPLAYVRVAYGAALLVAPDALLDEVSRGPVDRRARVFARVLGARQLLEGTVIAAGPQSPAWLRAGAAVDGIHATTMIAMAIAAPRRRRLALANAAVALALAATGLATLHGRSPS